MYVGEENFHIKLPWWVNPCGILPGNIFTPWETFAVFYYRKYTVITKKKKREITKKIPGSWLIFWLTPYIIFMKMMCANTECVNLQAAAWHSANNFWLNSNRHLTIHISLKYSSSDMTSTPMDIVSSTCQI